MKTIKEQLSTSVYPGRGIILGITPDGANAAAVYFIMGRSENSRNRIFEPEGDDLKTAPFDKDKVIDPTLIIYKPVRMLGSTMIVTNGDQTDTIYDEIAGGGRFEDALAKREYEPDEPNFTPRISGIMNLKEPSYKLSILKKDRLTGECLRFIYDYRSPAAGVGRFIHTYEEERDILPSFEGEPKKLELINDIDELTNECWNSLNPDNKVSLFTRFVNLDTLESDTRIVNKYM